MQADTDTEMIYSRSNGNERKITLLSLIIFAVSFYDTKIRSGISFITTFNNKM